MRNLLGRSGSGRKVCGGHKTHVRLERLEDRTVLSTFTVTNLLDGVDVAGSLRQAIIAANSTSGDDTINFGVTGTINLTRALPDLSTNIDIEGPGANLLTVRQEKWTAPKFYRIFTVVGGATVILSGLTISHGWKAQGAGIANSGTLTVNNATITDNWNGDNFTGGGIWNAGMLTLNNSTVSDNVGVNGGITNFGTLLMTNSTVSGNNATGDGGGIDNHGTLALNNSTISGNDATGSGGGIYNQGTLNTRNTIIAGNTSSGGSVAIAADVAGNLGSLGYNLIGNTSGGSGFRPTDQLNVDPLLGPLQDNGGPTFTNALLPGSPAVDAGNNTNAPLLDQRGFARIVNGRIDIGAYEVQPQENLVSTTTSLTSSPNPSVYGQPVLFTASVAVVSPGTGTPSGTVTFTEGTTVLGTGTLMKGQVLLTTSSLGSGTHTITAVYNGDANFSVSTSTALAQSVNPARTSTSLTSSPNPAVYGQSVTFTANVANIGPGAGTPTGTVIFREGTTVLGTGTLSLGQVQFTTSSLDTGAHVIDALYLGDTNFSISSDSSLTQTVNPASTATVLTSSAKSSVYGQSVTFTAKVDVISPGVGTPTGMVIFQEGTTVLGFGWLSGGQVQFTTTTIGAGTHAIAAVYNGDTDFSVSTATTPRTLLVNLASTATSLTWSPDPSVYGQAVTITANVAAVSPGVGTPTGTVIFKEGTTVLGIGTLSGGQVQFTTSSLDAGSHSITAVYDGDANFIVSTATAVNHRVNPATTVTALTSSTTPAVCGQSVTFTVKVHAVSPGARTPTGKVIFKDGGAVLGTGTLDTSGMASFTESTLRVGTHAITAVFQANTNCLGSTSAKLTQKVNLASTATALTSSANPSVSRRAVTFTVNVVAVSPGAGTPTGTVVFKDGTRVLGTRTLNARGMASFTTSSLRVGSHAITVLYRGNTKYMANISAKLTQTVIA